MSLIIIRDILVFTYIIIMQLRRVRNVDKFSITEFLEKIYFGDWKIFSLFYIFQNILSD